MPRLLVVDDDPAQLELRRLLLEHAGHEIVCAQTATAAREAFRAHDPDLIVLDLHLPDTEDGLQLIRFFRREKPEVRIVILSGAPGDLNEHPERELVDEVLVKPTRSATLMKIISKLVCLLFLAANLFGAKFPLNVPAPAEYVASLRMSAPGTDWARPGHEAALARITIDGGHAFHVMLYAGGDEHDYRVFLGQLAAGAHTVEIETEKRWSAPGATVQVAAFSATPSHDEFVERAPVLYARENTVGLFTDIPLLVYAEREGANLTYTVIFSNEDGGTSTRALMARWGRTTDIEYILRLDTRNGQGIIQAKDHKDIPFNGKYDGRHPILIPSTNNNMVSDEGESPIRYQIAPALVDLSRHSREQVMNDHPFTYRIMAAELEREGKLRKFGTVRDQSISDPRNYLNIEAKIANRDSATTAVVRLEGESRWRTANLGRVDYAIERDGWIQTTVELPPGTTPEKVAEIGFMCVLPVNQKVEPPQFYASGECTVEEVGKAFFLTKDYVPGKAFWSMHTPVVIPSGETVIFRIR